LVLAVILSNDIIDFKEIFLQPIIGSLLYTREAWLLDLLNAFDKGDLDKFESLKSFWTSQADLKANESKMRQKLNLIQVKVFFLIF
jgi:26S proteasome regulatory subunit N9